MRFFFPVVFTIVKWTNNYWHCCYIFWPMYQSCKYS